MCIQKQRRVGIQNNRKDRAWWIDLEWAKRARGIIRVEAFNKFCSRRWKFAKIIKLIELLRIETRGKICFFPRIMAAEGRILRNKISTNWNDGEKISKLGAIVVRYEEAAYCTWGGLKMGEKISRYCVIGEMCDSRISSEELILHLDCVGYELAFYQSRFFHCE